MKRDMLPRPLLRGLLRLGLLAAMTGVALLPARGQDLARRLILTDGSYQLVTKYEVKGDRVRYFSAERNDWEELPASLVDWPATEKYEKDRASGASVPEAAQFEKELEHDRELEEAARPQVAPGLRLPEDSGVFLLDSFQGEPQLVELQQTGGELNRNTKSNIFRGAINPMAGVKQIIEIDGAHSAIQSHVGVPSLYINAEAPAEPGSSGSAQLPQQPQQPEQAVVPFNHFRIIRAEVKGNKRVLGNIKRAVTGKINQEQHFVETTVTRVTGGWLKITPIETLPPGEYALVEMLGQEGMNLYVWDFGVNPKAPANANPWKPDVKSKPASSGEKKDN